MNKIKVIKIEDNTIINNNILNNRLQPAIVLKYARPSISIQYLKHSVKELDDRIIENLISMSNVSNEQTNKDTLISNIVNDMYAIAETSLKRKDDSGIPIVNLIKNVILEKVLTNKKTETENKTMLSVEDLMSKLYEQEEIGGKNK